MHDDESGESMEPMAEVPFIELGEAELERLVRGWRRGAGSWFQRIMFSVLATWLTNWWSLTFHITETRLYISRVVSVLDSSAEGPEFKSQPRRCLRQTVHTHCASVHQAAKLVAALLRVARVTAGLAESTGSLPSGLWLTSPAGWLPRTGISSGTLRSVIEYELPFQSLDVPCS